MNIIEATKAMQDGKRVTRPSWLEQDFLVMNEHGSLFTAQGSPARLNANGLLANDWRIKQ